MSNHSVIVAFPLAIITVFCFSYVLMQPPERLKKDETPAASSKPTILTGKPLSTIEPASLQDQTAETLSQANSSPQVPTSGQVGNNPSASANPQTPATSNPQQPAPATTGTGNYSISNKASDLPTIKVNLSQTITSLLHKL